jgi:hypothetical protein
MKVRIFLILGLLAALTAVGAQQQPFRNAPPEVEKTFRDRVTQFYTHFQQGQFRLAEQMVAEESRDAFYAVNKTRILGFEVQTIEFNSDLNQAKALVACQMLVPMLGSSTLHVPLQSQWKLIDGEWYIFMDTHQSSGGGYNSPAGEMKFNQNAGPGAAPSSFTPPNLATLKNMYQVSEKRLQFPRESTEPVTRTITVSNNAQGDLTVHRETAYLPAGLQVDLQPERIAPGAEGTISFTYDSKAGKGAPGAVEVEFLVMPITQTFTVGLIFQ